MTNLAFTAEVDLVVVCLSKTGNLIAFDCIMSKKIANHGFYKISRFDFENNRLVELCYSN